MANIIEKELIKKYKTQDKEYGYNIANGGDGICGVKGKDNWKSKPIYQYDLKGNFIREWENAQIASKELNIRVTTIYQSCRGTKSKPKMAGGYIWSYVKTDEIEEYTPGIPYYSTKYPILQINQEFKIVKRYKNIYHVDESEYDKGTITDCCKKKRLIHKDYYWCYENEYNENEFKQYIYSELKNSTYSKMIYQCDFNGKILNTYIKSTIAEEATGFKNHTILAWCKRSTHGVTSGYIWLFKIDYETIGIQNIIEQLRDKIDKYKIKHNLTI